MPMKDVSKEGIERMNMQEYSQRTDTYIKLVPVMVSIAALIVSIASAYVSWSVYSNQQIIQTADLHVGNPQYTDDTLSIPLFNGYYTRYPAIIVSYKGWLNGKEIPLITIPIAENYATQYPKNFRFVEKDKPTFIDIIFSERPPNLNDSIYYPLYTIKTFTQKENLIDGKNDLTMEIHYSDFNKMETWTINPKFEVTILDGKIKHVGVVYVDKFKIKSFKYENQT